MFRNHYPKVELNFSSIFSKKRGEEIGGEEKENKKKNHPEILLKIQIPGPHPGLLIHVD